METELFLQILRHAVYAAGEFEQLTGHAAVEPCRAGNAVADQGDRAGLRLVDLCFVVFDLRTDDAGDLFGFQLHCLVHHTIL